MYDVPVKQWKFLTYLEHLHTITPITDEIIKMEENSVIKVNFEYTRDSEMIKWQALMPWFLGAIVKWETNFEYFPVTKIKGMLVLFIATHYSYVKDLQNPYEGQKSTTEIVEWLLDNIFPTIDDIRNTKIIDFQIT